MKKRMFILFLFSVTHLCCMEEQKKNKQKSIFKHSFIGKKVYSQLKESGIIEKKPRRATSFLEILIQQLTPTFDEHNTIRFADYKNTTKQKLYTCTFSKALKIFIKAQKNIACFTTFAQQEGQDPSQGLEWFITKHEPEIHEAFHKKNNDSKKPTLFSRYDMYVIQLKRLNAIIGNSMAPEGIVRKWVWYNQTTLLEENYRHEDPQEFLKNYVDHYLHDQHNIRLLLQGFTEKNIDKVKQALEQKYYIGYTSLYDEIHELIEKTQDLPPHIVKINGRGEKIYIPPLNIQEFQ